MIVIIVLLALLLGLLGGYVIIDKFIGDNKKTDNDKISIENNNINDKKEESISLREIEELMQKYLIASCGGDSFISDLTNDDVINYLAIKNTVVESYPAMKFMVNHQFQILLV